MIVADLNSVLYDIGNWVPIVTLLFLGTIVYLMFRTLSVMPKTKPQEIKAKKRSGVTWDDIAGVEGTKEELQEVVDFLSHPKRFKALGAKVPKGIMLHGPPGTGKTMLAKAVAHESGANFFSQLISELLPTVDKVQKVSIVPRGKALGYTLNLPQEDRYLKSREELIDYMKVLLGGRVAEQITFGKVTTGASDDLNKVTMIARGMVYEYGMGTSIRSHQVPANDWNVSEMMRQRRDEEVTEIAEEAYRGAQRLLSDNRDLLDEIARRLLENEVIGHEEIGEIMADHRAGLAPARGRSGRRPERTDRPESQPECERQAAPMAEALPASESPAQEQEPPGSKPPPPPRQPADALGPLAAPSAAIDSPGSRISTCVAGASR